MIFHWREVSKIPDGPGVYAWYYTPELTRFDLERVISLVEARKAADDYAGAAGAVRDLLDTCLFRYFAEEPYDVTLRGPLKPHYRGVISHQPGLSEALVERLVQSPERLWTIKNVLENSAPHFASPLYIGMSQALRARVASHKALIERYAIQSIGPFQSEAEYATTMKWANRLNCVPFD